MRDPIDDLPTQEARIEERMKRTFQNPKQLEDARAILKLMQDARGSYAFVLFSFFALALVGCAWVGAWLAGGILVFIGVMIAVIVNLEATPARKKLAIVMEFSHVQFPYWKNIAEKLKKILEREREFSNKMLPPHVLNGGR